jgi:hypothetical protein
MKSIFAACVLALAVTVRRALASLAPWWFCSRACVPGRVAPFVAHRRSSLADSVQHAAPCAAASRASLCARAVGAGAAPSGGTPGPHSPTLASVPTTRPAVPDSRAPRSPPPRVTQAKAQNTCDDLNQQVQQVRARNGRQVA